MVARTKQQSGETKTNWKDHYTLGLHYPAKNRYKNYEEHSHQSKDLTKYLLRL